MAYDPKRIIRDARGRFCGYETDESSVAVMDRQAGADARAERAELLASEGYVPAVATTTAIPAATTAQIARWWGQQFTNAEYNHRAGDHLAMPDDYTPNMTGGRAMSGHRRTHRMNYTGADGTSIRMPSKTSIKRFSAEHNNRTFDVPISATIDGKNVTGHVRVSKGPNGTWETKGLGFPGSHGARIAEGVSRTLEGQRPRISREQMNDVIASRAAVARPDTVDVEESNSSWIKNTSFTPDAPGSAMGTFTMTTRDATRKDGSVRPGYAYTGRSSAADYATLTSSSEPGKVWNDKFKGRTGVQRVEECTKCGLPQVKPHASTGCPRTTTTPRSKSKADRSAMLAMAQRLTAGTRKG